MKEIDEVLLDQDTAPALEATEPEQVQPSPQLPKEYETGEKVAKTNFVFPMTGAQVFANACKQEHLDAVFCCPGNYEIISSLAIAGVPVYSGRTESGMAHAGDAFCRTTGEVAAVSGNAGPGMLNMVAAIAGANAARSPILVLANTGEISKEDMELALHSGDHQASTAGIRKYGKKIVTPDRIHEYAGHAFRQLKSGIPRPVHLDFPIEVVTASYQSDQELKNYYDKKRYRTESRPQPEKRAIEQTAEILSQAKRPMIVSSNGVFYSKAWGSLQKLAEKADIPVVESGVTKGQFSDSHRLCANTAPNAFSRADVVLFVGQYCMPSLGEFAFSPHAKYLRIDLSSEDIGRNIPIELGIVSCEKAALEALADTIKPRQNAMWVAEIAAARLQFEQELTELYKIGSGYRDAVHPAVIAKELGDFLYKGKIPPDQTTIVSGGYGIARYTRRWLRSYRPGQIMNGPYQYGAVGPEIAFSVGASVAVQQGVGPQQAYQGSPAFCIIGDAGFGFTGMEIETLARYRLPVVILVYNNNAWGTFRQSWTGGHPVDVPLHLFQENIRYDKIAEALGAHGEYVNKPDQFRSALQRAYDFCVKERKPAVLNCQGRKEFWEKSMPPGFLGKVEPGVMSYYH